MNPETIKWLAIVIGMFFGIKTVLYIILGIQYEGSILQLKDACNGLTRNYRVGTSTLITMCAAVIWWFA